MFPARAVSNGSGSVDIGDNIANSLMLDSASSQYLSKTLITPTSATIWSLSIPLKRGTQDTGTAQTLFSAVGSNRIYFDTTEELVFMKGAAVVARSTGKYLRDPIGFASLIIISTGTVVTAYLNDGSFLAYTGTLSGINTAIIHELGRYYSGANNYFDGYFGGALIFVDGQALTPSSFGRISADTGQWVPKTYTGTYGNNGFKLDFSNSAALGTDSSGNGNNWTLNGGITSANQYTDTPTKNHSVFNKLSTVTTSTLSVGNTKMTASTIAIGSLGMYGSMKSYWEVSSATAATLIGMYGTAATTTISVAAAKTYGMRFDAGAGTLDYINITDAGSWTSLATGLTSLPYFQYASTAASAIATINSGSKTFVGTVPSGYLALNTANMPEGTAAAPATFTGNALADGTYIAMNGTPETLSINGNAVTWGTHADRTAGGVKLRTASASYNASGSNTISASTFLTPNRKSVQKYQTAKGNP